MNVKLLILSAATINLSAFAAPDDIIPSEAKQALSLMPDKAAATDLLNYVRIVVSRNRSVEYSNASKRLLESGNEELALLAIDDSGFSLNYLEGKKEWKISELRLLVRAILKMSLPDEAAPSGEERSGRLGAVHRLAVVLARALEAPLPSTESFSNDPGNASSVKAWLRAMLNLKLRDGSITTETRRMILDSLGVIEKQKPLPAP